MSETKPLEYELIDEVRAFASDTGKAVSSVCVAATGNSRLIGVLERRHKSTLRDASRLRGFMAEHRRKQKEAVK